jgi:ABC-type bacteriocin/lantibiotic exporter with double-glycine peptidase domain
VNASVGGHSKHVDEEVLTVTRWRIRRVVQMNETDCGIACILMVTGRVRRYVDRVVREQVLKKATGNVYTRHHHLLKALRLLGLKGTKMRFSTWQAIPTPAIVPIRRRADSRHWHWVVLRGEGEQRRLLDPEGGARRFVGDFRGYQVRGDYIAVSPYR